MQPALSIFLNSIATFCCGKSTVLPYTTHMANVLVNWLYISSLKPRRIGGERCLAGKAMTTRPVVSWSWLPQHMSSSPPMLRN